MPKFYPQLKDIRAAAVVLKTIMNPTPLNFNQQLSKKYNAKILEKREDLVEPVRSYKLRGAFNKMYNINKTGTLLSNGIITCSAGNHAQGVAYSCNKLNINGIVFMPKITTKQKIDKVKNFGGKYVKIFLEGNNFDESFDIALKYSLEKKCNFIHPFDDEKVIEGQATVGLEIINQMKKGEKIDYIFLPVGGGGLLAGVSTLIKQLSPKTKIIGLEPLGAPSMSEAIKMDKVIKLDKINSFVDGASVKKVGELNFPICKENLDKMLLVDEGHVCSKILEMYNESGYVIEPAGVLSLCGLDLMKDEIINKNVVCIISGGNSDVFRMPEILERSLLYEGKKQYFKIEFAQTAGALKEFIMSILGPNDDIIHFKYTKIINKETGPVIIGIETKSKTDSIELINKMNKANMIYEKLTNISDI
jgi:threonine dehydratase